MNSSKGLYPLLLPLALSHKPHCTKAHLWPPSPITYCFLGLPFTWLWYFTWQWYFCIGLVTFLYPLIVGSFLGHTHVTLNVWLLVALCKHFLSLSVHFLAFYSWTMLTFSLEKHLKFSDPSIFTLSLYLISRGSTAVFPHSGRAAFLLVFHWLTTPFLFWFPASHCFVGTLCWNSHLMLNWPRALLRKSVICCLSTESWQQDLAKGTAMSCFQSLPVSPSGSIILTWTWSEELWWLTAWWLFRIRFTCHDADKCLHFCSLDHSVFTALPQICPSLGSHVMPLNLLLICVVLTCVRRSMDTAHWRRPFSQTTAVQV